MLSIVTSEVEKTFSDGSFTVFFPNFALYSWEPDQNLSENSPKSGKWCPFCSEFANIRSASK